MIFAILRKLREPSKKEGIISSTDSNQFAAKKWSPIYFLRQFLLNVPNGDLVAVKINGSNVQTNGQESFFSINLAIIEVKDIGRPLEKHLLGDSFRFRLFNNMTSETVEVTVLRCGCRHFGKSNVRQ
ncbi:hypothetical protein TNCV_33551 [Trichonephila clavipes]|nr:hypothetical protein TNCV_33551 [Trichonephila clavipes]